MIDILSLEKQVKGMETTRSLLFRLTLYSVFSIIMVHKCSSQAIVRALFFFLHNFLFSLELVIVSFPYLLSFPCTYY